MVAFESQPRELRLEDRWYAPLLASRHAPVVRALDALVAVEPVAVARIPRAGLGAAWLLAVVDTHGRPRSRHAVRAAALGVELYNLRQFTALPDVALRQRWASEQAGALRKLANSLLDTDQALALAVLENWRARPLTAPQPESVLFLRGVTGLAAVLGRLESSLHARLDRVAEDLGWRCEAFLDEGVVPRPVVLDALPHSALVEALESCLAPGAGLTGERQLPSWQPVAPAPLAPVVPTTLLGSHQSAVERALREVLGEGAHAALGHWLLDRGGKRVRPALSLAAAMACGGDPVRAVPAAALVEWLHQASLVLDDCMDGSAVRRGAPTLHEATDIATALGGFCWLLDRVRLAAMDLPEEVRETLLRGARELALGQHEELCQTGVVGLDRRTYHRILAGKTASLFGVAATVGAQSVGASPREVKAANEYARCVGLAFQVIDDLLDYTGSLEGFGKAPGVDLRAHKVTLPVMLLRRALRGVERARLDALLAERIADEADLAWVQAQLSRHGVVEAVRAAAQGHLARAERALGRLSGDTTALQALAVRCVERVR